MLTAKFDPATFFTHVEHIALCVPAGEIFSLLKRSIRLPSQWAALVNREVGDHVAVPSGGIVDAEGAESVLFVRSSPFSLNFEVKDLRSQDGYTCDATIQASLLIPTERSELESFNRTVLGSHRVVHIPRMTGFLQQHVRDALTVYVAERAVASLTNGDGPEAEAVLSEALSSIGFASGLALHGSPSVRFDSATWGEVHAAREKASARKAELEAHREVEASLQQARVTHVEELQTLLDRLRAMQSEKPAVSMPGLLRTFSERQRGELYAALFAEEAAVTHTEWIVAAAGDEVLFFRPSDLASPARRFRIALPVGPMRSVQTDDDGSLWFGAAIGVFRLCHDRAEPDLVLSVPGARDVRGGFNSVVASDNRVWATHSELGIIHWSLDAPHQPERFFEQKTRGAKAVRDIRRFDDQLFCGIDREILQWSPHSAADGFSRLYTGSGSAITAVCPSEFGVIAGNSDGDVLHWPRSGGSESNGAAGGIGDDRAFKNPTLLHRGMKRAVESVWMVTTHGVPRLVFADTSARVHVRVWGDNFASQYEAGGQTLRRVEVAEDFLVATNELRDRLICWTAGRPDKPPITIPISRLTGHAIQDVCLMPEEMESA